MRGVDLELRLAFTHSIEPNLVRVAHPASTDHGTAIAALAVQGRKAVIAASDGQCDHVVAVEIGAVLAGAGHFEAEVGRAVLARWTGTGEEVGV